MNIVIVGGGFGGVKAALELSKKKTNSIILISNNTNFQYYPALFSTATGRSYQESWVPLSSIFKKHPNVRIVHDLISSIDPDQHTLHSKKNKTYKYDKLILALGSVTTYFGIQGLDRYSFGIKSEEEIRTLQHHLMKDMSDGKEDETNYVIVGAGPTGVELAGALGEYIMMLREHYNIHKKRVKITLIEAAPKVLPRLSEASSEKALHRLKDLGITVKTGKMVQEQTSTSLIVDSKELKTQTVIWTSGVANAPFYLKNASHFELTKRGKVVVDEYLQTREGVYVIGDNADTQYAGLAQTALHDAIFVAKRLNGSNKKYKVKSPPTVIPIGHKWALFEWGKLHFSGKLGAVMRRAADALGYSDVLPISWAVGAWRASSKKQMALPDHIYSEDK